ncbi:MAG TPA: ribonuclease Y [Symbiobacteriaceae bacterium]|nr:ribonuclease Y [Symbiobacteriaceae bacterium]
MAITERTESGPFFFLLADDLFHYYEREVKLIFYALFVVLGLILGGAGGFYFGNQYYQNQAKKKLNSAEARSRTIVDEALREAEAKKKEAVLEAKEEVHRLRADFERESKERRAEVQRLERRLVQKEETLDRKVESLERKEEGISRRERDLEKQHATVQETLAKQLAELERISGLTTEEARKIFLEQVEGDARGDAARLIREIESDARENAEKRAREIVGIAIQRVAADHSSELTVSVVQLPNDEMKGRIIGREGRNIRTLETLTGIDLIIDDTPEAVVLSGFDPVRREVAKIALQKLIADGRIHPARIEEMVEKAQREVENRIREQGEAACFELGIHNLHPELIKLLGRLSFRTSYGQNVLKHSVEVAHLAGVMAAELGVNVEVAKRAGLLHDIGKAVDHEIEGPHVAIGVSLLKRYKETSETIHAMECHHGDVEPRSVEAVIVTAADAISAARPGARRETLETYIKRLEKLENLADGFEGVEKSFAIQAGREIRVMVKPEKIDDYAALKMTKDIAKKIEEELEYPGQIKVVVVRETRAVEYAR